MSSLQSRGLGGLDVDLLRAFDALMAERSVNRAAKAIGITQPALSARLARLRHVFSDQLLVLVDGRRMLPTPRALDLQPAIADVLLRLRDLAAPREPFDAKTTDRVFTVAAYDNPAMMLLPELFRTIADEAYGVRLALLLPSSDLAHDLEGSDLDLFIGGIKGKVDGLMTRKLLSDTFVTAQRRGHPRGTDPLTLDAFCAAEHLLISSDHGGSFSGVVDEALASLGRRRRVRLSVQSYGLAPLAIASSDCLCTLPKRFLSRFTDTLDLFEPPIALKPFQLSAMWHPRMNRDPAHAWLRDSLIAAAAFDAR